MFAKIFSTISIIILILSLIPKANAEDPAAPIDAGFWTGWIDMNITDFIVTDPDGNVIHGYKNTISIRHVYVFEQHLSFLHYEMMKIPKFKIVGHGWDSRTEVSHECGEKKSATNTQTGQKEIIEVPKITKGKFIVWIQIGNALDDSKVWIKREVLTTGCSGVSMIIQNYVHTISWGELVRTPVLKPPVMPSDLHSCPYDMDQGAKAISEIITKRIQERKELRQKYVW